MHASHAELLGDVDPAALGSRLRAARIAAGLTQSQLAGEDVSVGYVSRIESGSRRPNLKVLVTLAERLHTPVDQLLRGVTARKYDEIRLGLDYAELALESGEAVDAERQARAGLDAAESASLPELAQRARYLLGRALETLGDLDTAITELEKLVHDAEGLILIRAGIALSRCYRECGDLALAIEVGERIGGRIAEAGLDGTDEAVQLSLTIAVAHIERGDLHRASRMCREAIEKAEELALPIARSGAYWNASIVHAQRGETGLAQQLASRALALLSEGQDARNLARLRIQLGDLQLQQDPPALSEALDQLGRARNELSESSASEVDRARNEIVLAQAYLLSGDPDLAVATVAAVQDSTDDRATPLRAEALVVCGQALAAQGRIEDARASYQRAVHVLSGVGADRSAAQLWFELADLLEEVGDFEAARRAYRSAAATTGLTTRRARVARVPVSH